MYNQQLCDETSKRLNGDLKPEQKKKKKKEAKGEARFKIPHPKEN